MRSYWVTYRTEDGYRKMQVMANNIYGVYMKFMLWWRSNNHDAEVDVVKIALEGED